LVFRVAIVLLSAGTLSSAFADIIAAGQAHYQADMTLNVTSFDQSNGPGTIARSNCVPDLARMEWRDRFRQLWGALRR
jgi:hypothetical protein